ncbi:MAG TPA: SpoIVB peptidase S55 domain-containing protein [Bryobacteraceae bacterium]|nr:SpoIVB peptidase S55 domain-containing protein [Bryobacteraceae bacterium]
MLRSVVPAVFALAGVLPAQTAAPHFFPLKDVRPGMHGVGRTVFSGSRIDEFQVEILGVLENFGPKESLILARLSGGPLEHTGVMQGMSGSPVYLDGRLAGAVALAFPFSKDPIAGIRPIEEMLRPANNPLGDADLSRRPLLAFAGPEGRADLTRPFTHPEPVSAGDGRMIDISTPLSFGGFTRATLDAFAPQLRPLGLEPRQAVTAGARIQPGMGNPADLKPGSMISVQLLSGDFSVAADGTVTYIDGNRIYAFGHRFLDVGSTALPFARADVIALIPNVNTAFKLSAAREWMGAIYQDRDTAIAGELGRSVPLVPVTISVARGGTPVETYRVQMVNDALLSPLLLQMAVFSSIDATERTTGAGSLRISGEVEFQNAPAPVRLDNMYTADNGSAMLASLSAAVPVAYVMQSGFTSLQLKSAAIRIEAFDRKKQLSIENVTASRHEVRPGDRLTLHVTLAGEDGAETVRRIDYAVPIGAPPGTLNFTVADANTANISDFRQILTATPYSAAQIISTVNHLHPNTKAYVRVWRADPAYQLAGADLPDPPASVALVLAGSQSSLAGITQVKNSKIAEMELDGGGMVISGVKTIQVEVKE